MDLSRPCFDRVLAFVADETVVSCSAVAVKKCTILSVGCCARAVARMEVTECCVT